MLTYKVYWLLFKEAWTSISNKLATIMPPGPAKLWTSANVTAQSYVLAVVEAEPGPNVGLDARKAAITTVVAEASKQVGGRVLASAHVLATQDELDLALNDAEKRFGIGTVQSAWTASQEVVNAVSLRTGRVLDLSSTLGDVTKWRRVVADLTFLLGSATGYAGVAQIGEQIRLINVGLIGFVAATSFSEEAAQEREGYLEDLTNTLGTYAGFTADRVRLYASIGAYLRRSISTNPMWPHRNGERPR